MHFSLLFIACHCFSLFFIIFHCLSLFFEKKQKSIVGGIRLRQERTESHECPADEAGGTYRLGVHSGQCVPDLVSQNERFAFQSGVFFVPVEPGKLYFFVFSVV